MNASVLWRQVGYAGHTDSVVQKDLRLDRTGDIEIPILLSLTLAMRRLFCSDRSV